MQLARAWLGRTVLACTSQSSGDCGDSLALELGVALTVSGLPQVHSNGLCGAV